jgi:hypothetical protein
MGMNMLQVEITDSDTIDAMIRYGGSFAKRLGEAFLAADAQNAATLQAAFPKLWTEYQQAARLHKARAAQGR